jgi:hypothetical protein
MAPQTDLIVECGAILIALLLLLRAAAANYGWSRISRISSVWALGADARNGTFAPV